ncbi:uncharacterized protein LOC129766686 [Toxorhynchites rutilus septentrionalis]|uniref:uncharacterized protein LOC129766686 n=1 Tax=Toxorhynchites rutilus septentrionalis TaxID=329112 RepID=UPI002478B867|nr:uncharacterized protein LOC129766686 [Toxorhynchites rutilus septentrionalis]
MQTTEKIVVVLCKQKCYERRTSFQRADTTGNIYEEKKGSEANLIELQVSPADDGSIHSSRNYQQKVCYEYNQVEVPQEQTQSPMPPELGVAASAVVHKCDKGCGEEKCSCRDFTDDTIAADYRAGGTQTPVAITHEFLDFTEKGNPMETDSIGTVVLDPTFSL